MTAVLSSKPPGLSDVSSRVFDLLSKHTAFPWPVMQAQCNRVGKDATKLSALDVRDVAELLAQSVARFGKPGVKDVVLAELLALAK